MTLGGRFFLAGVAVGLAGLGLLAGQAPFPPSAAALRLHPSTAALLSLGALLMVIGCFACVIQPALDPAAGARVSVATVRTSVAMFVTALTLANIFGLPLVLTLQRGIAAAGPGQRQVGPLGLAYLIASSEIPLLGVLWFRLVRPGTMSWRELGVRLRPIGEQVQLGLLGGIGLFATAGIFGALLTRLGIRQNQYERFQGIEGAPLALFALALLAGCVLAPLVEELFFRGYVFQTFWQRRGPWWSYLFSALLFAAAHANLPAAAPIFVMGLMLAYLFRRTGSIVPGMIAHGLNNAISFSLLYWGFRG
ncbi:MAG TPA: CPBP family intramembrane glutamic endopeptidase [Chloroflexota bacterium]|nr:CPBP family intramembrane glutamic endopeptidase [Chloroflexota bacterium]